MGEVGEEDAPRRDEGELYESKGYRFWVDIEDGFGGGVRKS